MSLAAFPTSSITTSPTRREFLALARTSKLVPVYHEVVADLETPVSALLKLGEGEHTFLLESVEKGESQGRYSFLGNSALLTVATYGRKVILRHKEAGTEEFVSSDPLQALENILQKYQAAPVKGLPPFYGGAVGYLGYDAAALFEPKLPPSPPNDLDLPDSYFMITDEVLVFDHVKRCLIVVVNAVIDDDPEASYNKARAQIAKRREQLAQVQRASELAAVPSANASVPSYKANFSVESFKEAVEQVREHIAAGDIFQAVLSQRLSMPMVASPLSLYRTLRTLNPSPYMFYLKFPAFAIVGSSPEVMVRLEGNQATLRPIAGTRPRGNTAEQDQELARELLADEKERAEHVMLVDLGRNDLGRVCEYGTVTVDQLMTVEKYSHVMHIVSNVQGRLAQDKTCFDLLRATFPAGTVSGAPKLRAMEIINSLEAQARGPYAGCIGYFGFGGDMDSCITIRTVIVKDGYAHVQAGAGIVADSDPQREYAETLAKAQAVLRAIQATEVPGA